MSVRRFREALWAGIPDGACGRLRPAACGRLAGAGIVWTQRVRCWLPADERHRRDIGSPCNRPFAPPS